MELVGEIKMEITTITTPMSNDEIVENLKTMVFGKQAFERFNAKERETLDRAWNIIDQYKNHLNADMIAMLIEIQLEIEEKASEEGDWIFAEGERFCGKLIQQKINSLKES